MTAALRGRSTETARLASLRVTLAGGMTQCNIEDPRQLCWRERSSRMPISEAAHFLIGGEAHVNVPSVDGSSSVRNEMRHWLSRLVWLSWRRRGRKPDDWANPRDQHRWDSKSGRFPDWLNELLKCGCIHFFSQGSSTFALPRIRGAGQWDYPGDVPHQTINTPNMLTIKPNKLCK